MEIKMPGKIHKIYNLYMDGGGDPCIYICKKCKYIMLFFSKSLLIYVVNSGLDITCKKCNHKRQIKEKDIILLSDVQMEKYSFFRNAWAYIKNPKLLWKNY